MRVSPRRCAASFPPDKAGVAAIEFAFLVPIMLLLSLGGFDLGRFVMATEQVGMTAYYIAQMISEAPLSTSATIAGDGTVASADLQFYHDAAMVIFPDVLSDSAAQGIPWSQDIGITMTSIKFKATPTGCTTSCSYVPQVVWSGGTHPRVCGGTITAAADASTPSSTTLPTDMFGSGSLIVVDITYTFRPYVGSQFLPSFPIARSFYIAPRNVPTVEYSGGTSGFATACSGVL